MTEEQLIEKIISDLGDAVTGPADFFGDAKPSFLFRPMVKLLYPLLSCDPDKMISKTSIRIRKILHPILLRLLPAFMKYKQVIERKIEIPQEPVIWCPTHCFEDDIAASIGAARHAYILFGSIPALFNRLDGVGAYVNGVVICNRKVKSSKRAATEASAHLLDMGMDLILFPEGVWNKTPDKLLLDFWPGAYRLAKETGCKIVPVIHYLADPHEKYDGNVIHTIIADPISMEELDEQEGQELLRDTMATWYFRLMEKYGQTTREELLDGFETADDAWESYMEMHTGCVRYYDREIELCADYRPKQIVRPEDVWQSVANIQNIHAGNASHVRYARALVEREKRRDFQRRF